MIRRHVAGPNRGPYRLKRPANQRPVVLTQVLVGQPNNGLLNKGPFTARSQIWPINFSPNIWAHLRPKARSGPLIVRPIFGPIYGPKPDLARSLFAQYLGPFAARSQI